MFNLLFIIMFFFSVLIVSKSIFLFINELISSFSCLNLICFVCDNAQSNKFSNNVCNFFAPPLISLIKSLLSLEDLLKIARLIKGARRYALQKFVPSKTLDPAFQKEALYSEEDLQEFQKKISPYVTECLIR